MIYLVFITIITLLGFYRYIYSPRVYWKRRNIPSLPTTPIFGNFFASSMGLQSLADAFMQLYRATNDKLVGIYFLNTPVLLVKDLEMIRSITIKHFDHFTNHSKILFSLDIDDQLKNNLFNSTDDDWRNMRVALTPAFTGNKMRTMYPLLQETANDICKHFSKITKQSCDSLVEFHAKDICARFTNDVIATIFFGIRVNSLEEKENEFFRMGERATQFKAWKPVLINLIGTKLFKMLGFQYLDGEATKYLFNVFNRTLKTRRQDGIVRNDMLNLLLQAQDASVKLAKEDPNIRVLTDEDLLAQTFLFFAGGYDTTSTQLCFTILELAMNLDVQQKLYEEIVKVMDSDGSLNYEQLMNIKYLNWVIQESQRKWLAGPSIDRLCNKDIDLEDEKTGVKYSIKKGDTLFIPLYGIQRDPRIYPNPEVFDPERFNEENSKDRHPCAFLGFGSGPRYCIGNRFALLSIKVMLAYCIKNFVFEPTDNTEMPITLKLQTAQSLPRNDIVGVRMRK